MAVTSLVSRKRTLAEEGVWSRELYATGWSRGKFDELRALPVAGPPSDASSRGGVSRTAICVVPPVEEVAPPKEGVECMSWHVRTLCDAPFFPFPPELVPYHLHDPRRCLSFVAHA